VSYKQSVGNVKSAWGLDFTALTSGSLLTWAKGLADGEWHFRTNDAVSDTPINYLLGVVYVKDGNRRILAYRMAGEDCWTNFRTSNLDWATWKKIPTRAEVDALSAKVAVPTTKFSNGSTKTYTLGNNYRGVLFITDSSVNSMAMYFISTTSTGTVAYKAIITGSYITLGTGTAGALTITASSGSPKVMFITLSDIVPTA
jgi:hypothetical protein